MAILGGYCLFGIIMFSSVEKENTCKSIVVEVNKEYDFIDEKDVNKVLKSKNIYPLNKKLNHELANKIEKELSHMTLSKNVECYVGDSTLYVEILQRKPVYRVISGNTSYYVDSDREIMPTSRNFTANVPIVLGGIDKTQAKEEVYDLVEYIENDKYWKALFRQIYITDKKEVILISTQGVEEIHLGEISAYKEKLDILKRWYEQYPERNCDTLYSKISLKYNNLIYCTKKN